jgi:glucans biosynthesis protein C
MHASHRLAFFDNLRVALIAAVIAHHVGQAYGPTGGWWPIQEPTTAEILGPFFMVNRSFGMSLFFMIAGYFTVLSCDRGGPRAFMKSRFRRLGIPLLIFSVLVVLLQVFVFGPLDTGELGVPWPIDVAHLWFVQHLLIYSLAFAAWRSIRLNAAQPITQPRNLPGYGSVVAFALTMALATAIVRTWYSIDEWVYLGGYLRVAYADVPRDLSMFLVGILVYRQQWVTRFPTRSGYVWLAVGLILAGCWYAYEIWLADIVTFSDTFWGLFIPIWESLLCVAMSIGLTVFFREWVNAQGRLAKELADSSYMAYMLHIFVVILFQYLAIGLPGPPLAKFFLVMLITVPVTFGLASLLRRLLRI